MRLLFVAAFVTLSACSSRQDEAREPSLSDQVGDWNASLQQVNNSGVGGTARAQSLAAATGVMINISGAANGAHHPWHVHRGTCGSNGPVVGDANAYPALHVTDGKASATATIAVPLNETERYHVNVHRSATEMNVILACGELRH